MLLVKKKDGSRRICIDYQELNKVTSRTNILCPGLMTCLINLMELNLHSGYHQLKVKTEDISKMAFRTRYSHYEFLVMLGVTNAPAFFMDLMN